MLDKSAAVMHQLLQPALAAQCLATYRTSHTPQADTAQEEHV